MTAWTKVAARVGILLLLVLMPLAAPADAVIPALSLIDNPAGGQTWSVMGSPVATGEVQLDRELAINPGHIEQRINGVPTRDPAYGLEAVWIEPVQREEARSTQDPEALTSGVRVALGSTIVQRASSGQEELPVITLDPRLEQILQDALKGGADTAGIEPTLAERLQNQLSETTNRQEAAGQPAVLLVAPALRPWLARFLRFAVPTLRVLDYNEVPDSKRVRLIAAVGT